MVILGVLPGGEAKSCFDQPETPFHLLSSPRLRSISSASFSSSSESDESCGRTAG